MEPKQCYKCTGFEQTFEGSNLRMLNTTFVICVEGEFIIIDHMDNYMCALMALV